MEQPGDSSPNVREFEWSAAAEKIRAKAVEEYDNQLWLTAVQIAISQGCKVVNRFHILEAKKLIDRKIWLVLYKLKEWWLKIIFY